MLEPPTHIPALMHENQNVCGSKFDAEAGMLYLQRLVERARFFWTGDAADGLNCYDT